MSGSIPVELGNLTSLTGLWLQVNKLSGEEAIKRLCENNSLWSNVKRIGYVALCTLILNYSSRTACTNSTLQFMIEYDEIANHIHLNNLHLNLLCQGPFRQNWATWLRSLILVYLVTVYQVISISYHAREVGWCCMQWSPIAFHRKATHFIWIFSVRVHSGETGQPDLSHCSVAAE